jgi:hypothetical protein
VIAVAVLAGWVVGRRTEIPPEAHGFVIPFIAGGVILNVLKEELPGERQARFRSCALGAAGYAAVLRAVCGGAPAPCRSRRRRAERQTDAVGPRRGGPGGTILAVHVCPATSEWLDSPFYLDAVLARTQREDEIVDQLSEADLGDAKPSPTWRSSMATRRKRSSARLGPAVRSRWSSAQGTSGRSARRWTASPARCCEAPDRCSSSAQRRGDGTSTDNH